MESNNYLKMLCNIDNKKSYESFIGLVKNIIKNEETEEKEIKSIVKHVIDNYVVTPEIIKDIETMYPDIYSDTNNVLLLMRNIYFNNQYNAEFDFDYNKVTNAWLKQLEKLNPEIIFQNIKVFEFLAEKNPLLELNYNLESRNRILCTLITSLDLIEQAWEKVDKQKLLLNNNWGSWLNGFSESLKNNTKKTFHLTFFLNEWYSYIKDVDNEKAEPIKKDIISKIKMMTDLKEIRKIRNWDTYESGNGINIIFDIADNIIGPYVIRANEKIGSMAHINDFVNLIAEEKWMLNLKNHKNQTLSEVLFCKAPIKEILTAILKSEPDFVHKTGMLFNFERSAFVLKEKNSKIDLSKLSSEFWFGKEENFADLFEHISKIPFNAVSPSSLSSGTNVVFDICDALFYYYDLKPLSIDLKNIMLQNAVIHAKTKPSIKENLMSSIIRNELVKPYKFDQEVYHTSLQSFMQKSKLYTDPLMEDVMITCEKVELSKKLNSEISVNLVAKRL